MKILAGLLVLFYFLFWFGVVGTVGYVAYHFISKFW